MTAAVRPRKAFRTQELILDVFKFRDGKALDRVHARQNVDLFWRARKTARAVRHATGIVTAELVFRVRGETRRLRQNRLFWKWAAMISDYTGHHRQTLLTYFMEEAEKATGMREIYGTWIQFPSGSIMFDRKSTTGLDVQQFSRVMRAAEEFAIGMTITLPYPEDRVYE